MKNVTCAGILLSVSIATLTVGCDDKAKTDPSKGDSGSTSTTAAKDAGAAPTTTAINTTTTAKVDAGGSTTDTVDAGGTATATADGGGHHAAKHDEGAAFVIVPMKLVGGKDMKEVALEVKADGTLWHDGKQKGKFVGAHIEDDKGTPKVWVNKDNTIGSDEMSDEVSGHFDEKDNFVATRQGKEAKFVIADDGTIAVTSEGKTEKLPFKFEGLQPKARRAAMMLVLGMLMRGSQHAEMTGSDGGQGAPGAPATATPSATTAPTAKSPH